MLITFVTYKKSNYKIVLTTEKEICETLLKGIVLVPSSNQHPTTTCDELKLTTAVLTKTKIEKIKKYLITCSKSKAKYRFNRSENHLNCFVYIQKTLSKKVRTYEYCGKILRSGVLCNINETKEENKTKQIIIITTSVVLVIGILCALFFYRKNIKQVN